MPLLFLLRTLRWVLSRLPFSFIPFLGRSLGVGVFCWFKNRRKIAKENLRLALGAELSPEQQEVIVKKTFSHLSLNSIEFFRLQKINKDNLSQWVTFHGLPHLEKAYESQKGVLALTAHLGNWELLAAAISLKGFHTGMIVKVARQKGLEAFLVEQREAHGLKLFSGHYVIRPILKHLNAGGLLGIILDQHAARKEGVVVPFFGYPASTMKSLAVLAMRTEAPVLPLFTYREGNHHHILISPPLAYSKKDISAEQEIVERTCFYTKVIEEAVRMHPDQWTWTHRRWKC